MNGQTTPLFERPGKHSRIRQQLEAAWDSRQPGLPFRNLRTSSFATYGSGLVWLNMRKVGDNFIVGTRNWGAKAKYFREQGLYVPDRFGGEEWIQFKEMERQGHKFPIGDVMHRIFFVCTPKRTLIPAYVDISRNNMFWGMGHPDLQFHNTPDISLDCGVHVVAHRWGMDRWAVSTGLEVTDDGVYGLGTAMRDPVLQLYDKGIYNRMRESARKAAQLLNMYRRHNLIRLGRCWRGWPTDIYKWFYRHYDKTSEPFPVDAFLKEYETAIEAAGRWGYNPSGAWSQREDPRPIVAIPSHNVRRRQLREIGFSMGVFRLAPRGYSLYNEVPPWEPLKLSTDELVSIKD